MITHLEPDILECEVEWALGSFTMNKEGGGDGIPAELCHILKDDAVKVLHSIPKPSSTAKLLPSRGRGIWPRDVLLKPGLENFEHYCTSV